MTDTLIKNSRMLIKGKIREVDILIEDGRIEKISKIARVSAVDNIINAQGSLVLPSGIDTHVHFRDLEQKHREDWYTGSCSAAAGGITTVIDHPNTQPPTLNKKSFHQKLSEASRKSIIDFGINGGVSNDNLGNLPELWELGVTSFGEIFTAESTGKLNISKQALQTALNTIQRLDAVACIHAEDEELNKRLLEKHKGNLQPAMHSLARPPESEEKAVTATLGIIEKEAKVHFCHISTENAISKIQAAKKDNFDVTCEVMPHHLFLTTKDLPRLGTLGKMNPPLRAPQHAASLWNALNNNNNIIDIIASDHAPHTIGEKDASILDAPSGVPGVETLLPLMLAAVKYGKTSLQRVIETTRLNPAKRFNLSRHNKGPLESGFDADLIIVNSQDMTVIKAEKLHSKAGWTPYENMPAIFPRLTLLRGETIWDNGAAVKKGKGNFLTGTGKI